MGTRCFLLEPTGDSLRFLRRYESATPCPLRPGEYSYHDAAAYLDRAPRSNDVEYAPADDPRWPSACGCGYAFGAPTEIQRQIFALSLWRRADGQSGEYVLHGNPYSPAVTAPVGAMWYADWIEYHVGPDGRNLVVRCFGNHDWMVDGHASNCTMPSDEAHRCWVRHGTPPNITVDKDGLTCAAGAGSIQVPGWHGFLRNGELVE